MLGKWTAKWKSINGQEFIANFSSQLRLNSTSSSHREQIKHQFRERKTTAECLNSSNSSNSTPQWELTVGIEIHAQLNTPTKLFSFSPTTSSLDPSSSPSNSSAFFPQSKPNTHIAPHDLGYPGTQPTLQCATTIIPAIRAALALNCQNIARKSRFDRKHYFYADQPAGYQITQKYQPIAQDGHVLLKAKTGSPKGDGYEEEHVCVGIERIQIEQDTGKSLVQSSSSTLVDYNRAGQALIEIVSLPHIRHASIAAAYVRKIQGILRSVGAVTAGMEDGGLRADVNVSVRRTESDPLGQRTEIKNLNSFRAIEAAINAENTRQIRILEQGGKVIGETRGWTLGGTETHRLREKEGEVDYRYMPDADLGPLIIPPALIEKLKQSMPPLPEEIVQQLVTTYGLSEIDAQTLLSFGDGERLEYFYEVAHACSKLFTADKNMPYLGKILGNLILHDVGSLITTLEIDWTPELISPFDMVGILDLVVAKRIGAGSARELLADVMMNRDHDETIQELAQRKHLIKTVISTKKYDRIIESAIEEAPAHLIKAVQANADSGKLTALIGLCMRGFKNERLMGGVQHDVLKQKILDVLRKKEQKHQM